MAHARTPRGPLGQPCKDAVLRLVSKEIGKDVMKLGSALGIPVPKMEAIEIEEGKWGVDQMAFKTLDSWRREQPENATEEILATILSDIGRTDIEEKMSALSTATEDKSFTSTPTPTTTSFLTGNGNSLSLHQLQDNIRRQYKLLQMKGLPWMDNIVLSLDNHFVELEMINAKGKTKGQSKRLQLHQILKKSPPLFGKRPSRILVEGDPGFGKTTISTKLCYDYGNRQGYMNHFDIVLFFCLRNFVGSLDDMFASAAFTYTNQRSNLGQIINNKAVRTLLILDGYDELPDEHVDCILPLIRGDLMPHISLVVTSRPGKFTTNTKLHAKHFLNASQDIACDLREIWDRRVRITGINEKRQVEFIQKHLADLSHKERERITKQIKTLKSKKILAPDFLQCPLFLLMIVLLLTGKERAQVKHLKNRTELYKSVMNFVIRRYLTKTNDPTASTAELFSFETDEMPCYKKLVAQLGEISLPAIKANNLTFDPKDFLGPNSTIDERILELGILTTTLSTKGNLENEYYEPVHRSLIELAGSYSLLVQFITGPRDDWDKKIRSLRPNFSSAKSSLLFPFLAGLMGSKVVAIFEALIPHAAEYSSMSEIILPVLKDVPIDGIILSSIIPFLPINLEVSKFFRDHFVMTEYLKSGKIREVSWNLEHNVRFNCNLIVDRLVLFFDGNMSELNRNEFQRIECNTLVCDFEKYFKFSGNKWKNVLSLLSSIFFSKISFVFEDVSACTLGLPLICKAFTNKAIKEAKIEWICCILEKEGNEINILIDLIEKEIVEGLVIVFFYLPTQVQLDDLFRSVSKSINLTKFVVKCDYHPSLTIDLAQLCNGGKKSFQILYFQDITIHCNMVIESHKSRIGSLSFIECSFRTSIRKFISAYQVVSFSHDLCIQAQDFHLFRKVQSVFTTVTDCKFFEDAMYTRMGTFCNLKILTVSLSSLKHYSKPVDKWLLPFFKYMLHLQQIHIDEVEANHPLATEIVQSIARYLNDSSSHAMTSESNPIASLPEGKKSSIQILSFLCNVDPDLTTPSLTDASKIVNLITLVSSLKNSLASKALPQLDVVVENDLIRYLSSFAPNEMSSFVDVFPPEEGFVVRFDYVGMRDDDSPVHKLFASTMFDLCRFFITSL